MTEQRMRRLGVTLLVIAGIGAVAFVWWWALFGVTSEVGIAAGFTVWAIGVAGLAATT